VVGGRVPKIDDVTKEILSEPAIIVYLNYLDQLKQLYTMFIHQNFNAGKRVISFFLTVILIQTLDHYMERYFREKLPYDFKMFP
jgi:hypothetical protein